MIVVYLWSLEDQRSKSHWNPKHPQSLSIVLGSLSIFSKLFTKIASFWVILVCCTDKFTSAHQIYMIKPHIKNKQLLSKCSQVLSVLLQQKSSQEPGKIIQDLGYPAGHSLQPGVEKKAMQTNSWVLSVFMQKLISAGSSRGLRPNSLPSACQLYNLWLFPVKYKSETYSMASGLKSPDAIFLLRESPV